MMHVPRPHDDAQQGTTLRDAPRRETSRLPSAVRPVLAVLVAVAVSVGGAVAPASATLLERATAPAAVAAAPLTNLAHLDFLLDEATPPADVEGHTTYRLADEPTLILPWTYADAQPDGTFQRVGGGPLDEATNTWGQGAYNADDIARAAVVYLRHWSLTGAEKSRDSAYELLRSLAYLQTTDGPNAGNVVLWMQPDGTSESRPRSRWSCPTHRTRARATGSPARSGRSARDTRPSKTRTPSSRRSSRTDSLSRSARWTGRCW